MLALSGSADRLHLGDVFEWLNLTRANGRLLLTSGSVTRAFDLVRGKVAFASSTRASERLASWLLRKEMVERQPLLRALAVSQTQGESFTMAAEREAQVPHDTLVEAGRALATALASRILREERIVFRFDHTWPVTERLHVDLEMDCPNLMMKAAFRADTTPPTEQGADRPLTTLDPDTVESLFWRTVEDLEGELVDAGAMGAAHTTLLAVGELLHRWVTEGPPLLPLGPADAQRVARRLDAGEAVTLEDSPTLAWDLLSLVNGLDAPGFPRAASAGAAWALAGEDAPLLVRLILENPRWRREQREEVDASLRRAALARAAAGRALAAAADLPADVASTAAALPVVVLDLVATALTTTPLASPAMQRSALRQLLPLVGRAAGMAAGLSEVLLAALTGDPPGHPGARAARLAALVSGSSGMNVLFDDDDELSDLHLAPLLDAARTAAEDATSASSD